MREKDYDAAAEWAEHDMKLPEQRHRRFGRFACRVPSTTTWLSSPSRTIATSAK
jgi:hypothetical protein